MRIMLTLMDREEISRGLAEDLLFAEIAVRIGRDPSVVSRAPSCACTATTTRSRHG